MIKASRDSKCQTLEHRARNIPMNMSHISFKTLCVPCDVTHFLQNIVSHVTQQMDRETIQKTNNLHTADFRRQTTDTQLISEDKQLTHSWFQKTNNLHTADFRRQTTYTQLISEDNLHTTDFRRQAAGLEIGRKFRWQLAAIYKQFRKQFTDNPSGTQLKGKHAK